jgi:hypothetical protein
MEKPGDFPYAPPEYIAKDLLDSAKFIEKTCLNL